MRRVQEYLKEIEVERLINEYLFVHQIQIHEIADESMTIKEIKESVRVKLRMYIERLQLLDIEASEDGKEYVLFAHKVLKDGFEEEEYSLVCLPELIEQGENAETYAYEFTRQAEIIGFMVSDAEFTQKNIYGLLVDVMYEASFFGFEQQHLEKELQKLEEAVRECEKGKNVTYSSAEIWDKFGVVKEEKDERTEELQENVIAATMKYNQYCKQEEMRKLLESVI